MVAVDPVEDVEEAIQAKSGDIMRGDVLNDSDFVQHPDLRNEGNCLEPQAEAPGHLPGRPARVDDAGAHNRCRQEGQEMREVVARLVIGLQLSVDLVTYRAEGLLVAHQVDDESRRGDEENLHHGVVHRHVVHEEVHVPRGEDDQIQLLGLAREAYIVRVELLTDAVARLVDSVH